MTPLPTNSIAGRDFCLADQEAFAEFSGDRNPIHLDKNAARRTQAGAAVVHGVHGLLWALERTARTASFDDLRLIDARFNRFVYLGAQVDVLISPRGEGLSVQILTEGEVATSIKLEWGLALPSKRNLGLDDEAPSPFGVSPQVLPFEAMANGGGRCIQPGADRLAPTLFPALSAALGPSVVAAIAAASGVVGMNCPGLHSLFTQLTLRRTGQGANAQGLAWRATRTDSRARWVALALDGAGWEGEAVCLARQEPPAVRSMAALSKLVGPDEFACRHALIIGGSRGLGATTAKLLAAGGAFVTLTYARGLSEAEALADEISAARGPGTCAIHLCDVTGDVGAQLQPVLAGVTHLYYFATPKITRPKSRLYDRQLLDEFLTIYVDGFSAVWHALADNRPLTAFYPSTVFMDERPKGMTEYVMAKAAAELLCADLGRQKSDVAFMVPRIPRVLTDQTATSPPTPAEDPVEIMLPLLRNQSQ